MACLLKLIVRRASSLSRPLLGSRDRLGCSKLVPDSVTGSKRGTNVLLANNTHRVNGSNGISALLISVLPSLKLRGFSMSMGVLRNTFATSSSSTCAVH